MSDLRPLTQQEIFDRVYTHFVIEGHPRCLKDGRRCAYRNEAGDRCAIGLFIPNHEYKEDLEEYSVVDVVQLLPETGFLLGAKENMTFLLEIQKAHDGYQHSTTDVEIRMKDVAAMFGLTVPGE